MKMAMDNVAYESISSVALPVSTQLFPTGGFQAAADKRAAKAQWRAQQVNVG